MNSPPFSLRSRTLRLLRAQHARLRAISGLATKAGALLHRQRHLKRVHSNRAATRPIRSRPWLIPASVWSARWAIPGFARVRSLTSPPNLTSKSCTTSDRSGAAARHSATKFPNSGNRPPERRARRLVLEKGPALCHKPRAFAVGVCKFDTPYRQPADVLYLELRMDELIPRDRPTNVFVHHLGVQQAQQIEFVHPRRAAVRCHTRTAETRSPDDRPSPCPEPRSAWANSFE